MNNPPSNLRLSKAEKPRHDTWITVEMPDNGTRRIEFRRNQKEAQQTGLSFQQVSLTEQCYGIVKNAAAMGYVFQNESAMLRWINDGTLPPPKNAEPKEG